LIAQQNFPSARSFPHRHGRACPGHLRLSFPHPSEDVDARDEPGHDGLVRTPREPVEALNASLEHVILIARVSVPIESERRLYFFI
jgi:hypothetical protein